MQSRVCTKCNTEKPESEYYAILNKKTGNIYNYKYCKKCHYSTLTKHTAKKWREDNPNRWLKAVNKAQHSYFDRQKAGVYLLITDKGTYVGASDKITSRVSQHKSSKRGGNVAFKGATVIEHRVLEEIEDRDERLKRERYWIEKLQPDLNVMYTDKWKPNFLVNNPKKKK